MTTAPAQTPNRLQLKTKLTPKIWKAKSKPNLNESKSIVHSDTDAGVTAGTATEAAAATVENAIRIW